MRVEWKIHVLLAVMGGVLVRLSRYADNTKDKEYYGSLYQKNLDCLWDLEASWDSIKPEDHENIIKQICNNFIKSIQENK